MQPAAQADRLAGKVCIGEPRQLNDLRWQRVTRIDQPGLHLFDCDYAAPIVDQDDRPAKLDDLVLLEPQTGGLRIEHADPPDCLAFRCRAGPVGPVAHRM